MITVQKDEELNDYAHVWDKMGDKPNKIAIYSQYSSAYVWSILYNKYKIEPKSINTNTEAYNLEDIFISNYKYLITVIENVLYLSFYEFKDDDEKDSNISNIAIYYSSVIDKEVLQDFVSSLQEGMLFSEVESKSEKIVNYLKYSYQNGYDLEQFVLSGDNENIKYMFNPSTFKTGNNIILNANKNSNSISILYGENGTGKTKHLNYILSKIKKNIIYIPYQLIENSVSQYEFLNFISKFKETVFVIDDCEEYFTTNMYDKNNNIIKSLVQLCNGVMANNMNFNFILSMNISSETEIDEYLLSNTDILSFYGKLKMPTLKKLNDIYEIPEKKRVINKEISIGDFFKLNKNKEIRAIKIGY